MKALNRYRGRSFIGVAIVFSAQVAGAAFSFLFNILLARLIGASGVGLYFISTTIVDIGATISRLGLENAVLRFTAVAHTSGHRASLAGLYRTSLSLIVGMAIVIAVPAWWIVSRLALGGDRAGELRAVLPLLMLAFAPVAVRAIHAEFYKGIGSPGIGTFLHSVLPPLLLLLGGAVLWWIAAATFEDVVITYFTVAIFAVLGALLAWNQRQPGLWRQSGNFDLRLLLRTSLPLLLASFGYLAMNWTDIIVLGIYADPSEVGVYGIARRITILATAFAVASVNSVAAPRFAALYTQGNTVELARLARRCTLWMLLTTAPVILVLFVFPEIVLKIFGSQFENGVWPLRILALGQLAIVAVGPAEYLLMMTGHEKLLRNSIGAAAVMNIIGNLALVPRYGAIGAATATALCLAAMGIACLIMVKKKLKIATWDLPFRRN